MDLYFVGISFPHLVLFDMDSFSNMISDMNRDALSNV